jgi:predicted Zn-dependent protease
MRVDHDLGHRRDYLYLIASIQYELSDFSDAKQTLLELLQHEPTNQQALALRKRIQDAIDKGTREVDAILVCCHASRAISLRLA